MQSKIAYVIGSIFLIFSSWCGIGASKTLPQVDEFDNFLSALDYDTPLFVYCDDFNRALSGLEQFPLFEGDVVKSLFRKVRNLENGALIEERIDHLVSVYETLKRQELLLRMAFVVHSIDKDGRVIDWTLVFQFDKTKKRELLGSLESVARLSSFENQTSESIEIASADDLTAVLSERLVRNIACALTDDWIGIGTDKSKVEHLTRSSRIANPRGLSTNRTVLGVRNSLKKLHRESESFFFFIQPDEVRNLLPAISDDQWEQWEIDSPGIGGCLQFRDSQPGIIVDCILKVRAPVVGIVSEIDNYQPIVELPINLPNISSLFGTNHGVRDSKPKHESKGDEAKSRDEEAGSSSDDFATKFRELSTLVGQRFESSIESTFNIRSNKNNESRQANLFKVIDQESADELVTKNIELLNLFRKGFEISRIDIDGIAVWSQTGDHLRRQILHDGKNGRNFKRLEDREVNWDAPPRELWNQIPAVAIINLGDWIIIGDSDLCLRVADSLVGTAGDESDGIDLQVRLEKFAELISVTEPRILSMSDSKNSWPMRQLADFTFRRVMSRIMENGENPEEQERIVEQFLKKAVFPTNDMESSNAEWMFYTGLTIFTAYDSQVTCVSKFDSTAVRLSVGLYVDDEE